MQHAHEPYVEILLIALITPFVSWFIFRFTARFIFKPVWKYWYVRRAIDVSFIGCLVLLWVSFVHDWGLHYTPEQHAIHEKLYDLRDVAYQTHSRDYPASERLYQQYWGLSQLQDWEWFLDHLGRYVALPAVTVLASGYVIERQKNKQSQ